MSGGTTFYQAGLWNAGTDHGKVEGTKEEYSKLIESYHELGKDIGEQACQAMLNQLWGLPGAEIARGVMAVHDRHKSPIAVSEMQTGFKAILRFYAEQTGLEVPKEDG